MLELGEADRAGLEARDRVESLESALRDGKRLQAALQQRWADAVGRVEDLGMRTPLMRDRVASGPWACTRPLPDRPSSSTCSPYFQMALWQTQRQRLRGWRRRWRVRGQRRRRPPNSWRERKRLRRGGTRSRSGGYWSCRGQLTRREPAPTFCASTFQVSTGGFKLFVRCRRARVAFVCVCVCCAWRRVGLCQLITLHWRFPIYVSVLESDIRSNRSDASLLRESVAAPRRRSFFTGRPSQVSPT